MKRLFTVMSEVEGPLWWAKYRFLKTFIYPVREFLHWIHKSLQYAWFLRNDHDFDYVYILRLLRYKLLRTANQINKNQIIEDHKRVHNEITDLVSILDRVLDESYFSPELMDLLERSDPFDRKPNVKKLTPAEKRRMKTLLKRREEEKERDFKLFFDTLRLKIRSFWD